MGNHYHLVLHTRRPYLSALMHLINGAYTQAYNRRHAKLGHLFQGPVQGDPGRPGCLFAGGVPLCRPEPGAGADGD